MKNVLTTTQQHPHIEKATAFHTVPGALAFSCIHTDSTGMDYYVYTEVPLWDVNTKYLVLDSMTINQAKEDREETIKLVERVKLEEAREEMHDMVDDIIDALVDE